MNSMKDILSLTRRITLLEEGDFIYVHPRSFGVDDKSFEKPSYFGRFRGYADGENFYEVDLKVDVEFGYERFEEDEKGIWVPRRNIRNRGLIARVNTLEDDGYLLFAGERVIERGMEKNDNQHYYLVSDIIHGSARSYINHSRRRQRDKIKYA